MANFQAFASAMATVASHVTESKKFIYNIAQAQNFSTLYYSMMGRRMADILRAGSDVRARVKFSAGSQAGWYEVPTEEHAPSISQDGAWAIAYWCAHMSHETYKDEQLLVNSGGTGEGSLAEETWKQELWNAMQSLFTAAYNSVSASFWAVPRNATMNGTDPKQPVSIPALLNVHANGLFVEDAATTWASIHGINPVANAGFVPYRGTYASLTDATNATNAIYALTLAIRKTTFAPPPMNKEYFVDEDSLIENDKGVIFGSATGVSRLENFYRISQDRWSEWMDPSGNPKVKGCPLVHEAQLDSAAIYPDASGYGNSLETAADISGPRYYGINFKYLKMFWHRERHFKLLEPFRVGQTTWQQGLHSMGTLLCPDRSKHFFLSPSTDL